MSRITITIDVPDADLMQELMLRVMHPLMQLVAAEQAKSVSSMALNDATGDAEMSCVASKDPEPQRNDGVSFQTSKSKPSDQTLDPPSPTTPYSPPSSPSSATKEEREGFEEFWRAYPRKVCKAVAFGHYIKVIRKGASHHAIMHGVEKYPFSEDKQFIPHPATWLNQHRWEDVDDIDTEADTELTDEDWQRIIDPYHQIRGGVEG